MLGKVGSRSGRVRMSLGKRVGKKCTLLWRKTHLQVKISITLTASRDFLKITSKKRAWSFGETRVCKSKTIEHRGFRDLFVVPKGTEHYHHRHHHNQHNHHSSSSSSRPLLFISIFIAIIIIILLMHLMQPRSWSTHVLPLNALARQSIFKA